MSMQTLIIRGDDLPPDRVWCGVCGRPAGAINTIDQAREHVTDYPGHVVTVEVIRHDLMVAGGDLWVVSPYTMSEAAEGPSEG